MKGPVIKMSGDAADKLAACFAWACHSTDPTEQRYFDACARWWSMLTPQNQDMLRTIIDVLANPHKGRGRGHGGGPAGSAEAAGVVDAGCALLSVLLRAAVATGLRPALMSGAFSVPTLDLRRFRLLLTRGRNEARRTMRTARATVEAPNLAAWVDFSHRGPALPGAGPLDSVPGAWPTAKPPAPRCPL